MHAIAQSPRINIRPGVRVLAVFRHLNYKPWYALAEFVDNALQSFLTHREALQALHGSDVRLRVEIRLELGADMIVIRDNAAGIPIEDYQRAFETANPPLDTSGLSQFGVGLKSAACWFARHWSVRTKALGEPFERTIVFDVDEIVRSGREELAPTETPRTRTSHYTEVVLTGITAVRPKVGPPGIVWA